MIEKDTIKNYISIMIFCFTCIGVVYSLLIDIPWTWYNNYRLEHYGEIAVATVIAKYHSGRWPDYVRYDVEYNGVYYADEVNVSRSVFNEIKVGERFYALVLPDKLKYHSSYGITPSYIKLLFQPLPRNEQEIKKERERIRKMYGLNPDRIY
jgi:hypothetical protein